MKYKILSIVVVCLMLLTTFFAVAENIDAIEDKKTKHENLPLIFDDDVPVWGVGDSWTYVIDNVEFAIDDENLSEDFILIFNMQIGEFTLDVIDDSGDLYTCEILETSVTGNYELYTDLGDGPIEAIGDFEDTTLTGLIYFNKADLGIVEFDMVLDGRLTVNVILLLVALLLYGSVPVNTMYLVPYHPLSGLKLTLLLVPSIIT